MLTKYRIVIDDMTGRDDQQYRDRVEELMARAHADPEMQIYTLPEWDIELERYVINVVCDDDLGMAPETLADVFRPYPIESPKFTDVELVALQYAIRGCLHDIESGHPAADNFEPSEIAALKDLAARFDV